MKNWTFKKQKSCLLKYTGKVTKFMIHNKQFQHIQLIFEAPLLNR